MLIVSIPTTFVNERKYIIRVIMNEFLGLDPKIKVSEKDKTVIKFNDKRSLILPDLFFSIPENRWLTQESLPIQPLKELTIPEGFLQTKHSIHKVPIIYGLDPNSQEIFDIKKDTIQLGLDVFGSAFFMLTRYEEAVKADRDHHDRFPAYASLAHQEGFLNRPIVNEYVEILWAGITHLWPGLQRKQKQYRLLPTHDVDIPYAYSARSLSGVMRSFVRDVIKCRTPVHAVQNFLHCIQNRNSPSTNDPYNTFDWLMDISERNGLISCFYFITDHSGGFLDGDYSITNPLIKKLLRHIHERGHEIGLHSSYYTYKDAAQIEKEFCILTSVCHKEGISQNTWGNRQHTLRWDTPSTFAHLERSGLTYDTTLGFADHAGFRCGTCYEYTVFDVQSRRALALKERPLTAMECTVADQRYMNLGFGQQAFEYFSVLKEQCRMYEGAFVLLWHNSHLVDRDQRKLYEKLITN